MSHEQTHSNAITATAAPAVAVDGTKACDGCGTPFKPVRHWQKFHSDHCRNEYHRKKALGPEGRFAELEKMAATMRQDLDALTKRVDELEAAVARVPA